ncbi:MAG: DUF883 domain-containing protein [Candidatus Omnitrophica bacterium]|nr:DUF883 domain-containing protein [Candidatus Omnitrophota bacterium]
MSDIGMKTGTSSAKITEALELLNEAAKEKKDEIKGLITDKYSHIRQAMGAGAEQGKQMYDKVRQLAQNTLAEGEEKVKKAACEADKRVHKDPWAYIAGTAVVSLLLGYVMGSKRS